MNQDQADKIIENWRKATKELDTFLQDTPEFKYRWATIDGKRHVVVYYNADKIFMCGDNFKYQLANFDSLGEFV